MFTRTPPERVEGIGTLADAGEYWRLTYDGCSHIQEFPRFDVERLEDAIWQVRRHYVQCLTCRLKPRPRDSRPE